VATVAVPTPACTMTIGGHPCGVREREGERGAGVASRRVEGCSRFRQHADLLCTIGRENGKWPLSLCGDQGRDKTGEKV
jgi:hypothetical protein